MIKFNNKVSNIVIIGCGGVTSWMIAPLIKLLNGCEHKPTLVLVDGDTIEERNLERQWFDEEQIGASKALALAAKLKYDGEMHAVSEFFTDGMQLPVSGLNLFLGAADNHAARRAILATVDRAGGWAVIGGNEYTEAEGYFYEPRMRGTELDPRVYYPALLTDNTGDPTRPAGCTGLAAALSPQLVLANFSAANHMLWMLYHHFVERPSNDQYLKEYMPVKSWNYGTRFITTRACDLVSEKKEAA